MWWRPAQLRNQQNIHIPGRKIGLFYATYHNWKMLTWKENVTGNSIPYAPSFPPFVNSFRYLTNEPPHTLSAFLSCSTGGTEGGGGRGLVVTVWLRQLAEPLNILCTRANILRLKIKNSLRTIAPYNIYTQLGVPNCRQTQRVLCSFRLPACQFVFDDTHSRQKIYKTTRLKTKHARVPWKVH